VASKTVVVCLDIYSIRCCPTLHIRAFVRRLSEELVWLVSFFIGCFLTWLTEATLSSSSWSRVPRGLFVAYISPIGQLICSHSVWRWHSVISNRLQCVMFACYRCIMWSSLTVPASHPVIRALRIRTVAGVCQMLGVWLCFFPNSYNHIS